MSERATELDPGTTTFSYVKAPDPIDWSCAVVAEGTTRFDLDLTRK